MIVYTFAFPFSVQILVSITFSDKNEVSNNWYSSEGDICTYRWPGDKFTIALRGNSFTVIVSSCSCANVLSVNMEQLHGLIGYWKAAGVVDPSDYHVPVLPQSTSSSSVSGVLKRSELMRLVATNDKQVLYGIDVDDPRTNFWVVAQNCSQEGVPFCAMATQSPTKCSMSNATDVSRTRWGHQ